MASGQDALSLAFKGSKRKRLAKACDACHKSKRRCDGYAPCSNCYFAAKDCSYTDAAGRPVPAPCAGQPPPAAASVGNSSGSARRKSSSGGSSSSHSARTRRAVAPDLGAAPTHDGRKRARVSEPTPVFVAPPAPVPTHLHPPVTPLPVAPSPDHDSDGLAASLDPHIVRELVSIFFAHLYPMRLILHMPTFLSDLACGRVPKYLVHAVCAIAAPLYPDRPMGSAPRSAGTHHAAAARKLMFNEEGKLRVPRTIAAAQTLCLLQNNEHVTTYPWAPSLEYTDLAMQILNEDLHVRHADTPAFPDTLSRECARRCAWFIRFHYTHHLSYHSVTIKPPELDVAVPLPADEAAFDLAAVLDHTTPEFVSQLAPQGSRQSEYGHIMRISECLHAINVVLDKAKDDPGYSSVLERSVEDIERKLTAWDASLSPQLRYLEKNARKQRLMYETGSNSAAWCFFTMHVIHACTVLGVHCAKRVLGRPDKGDIAWARPRIVEIMKSLGILNTYNVIAAIAIFGCDKYCSERADPSWSAAVDAVWGSKLPPLPIPEVSSPASPPVAATSPAPLSSVPPSIVPPSSAPTSSSAPNSYFRSLGSQFARMRGGSPVPGSVRSNPHSHHHLALLDAPADLYGSSQPPPLSTSLPTGSDAASAIRRLRLDSNDEMSSREDTASVGGPSLPGLKESGLLDLDGEGFGMMPAPPVVGLMASRGPAGMGASTNTSASGSGSVPMRRGPPVGYGWLGGDRRMEFEEGSSRG